MKPFSQDNMPKVGTIFSLTVKAKRTDPRTRQPAATPQCFRVLVAPAAPVDPPGTIKLGGQPPASLDNGFARAMPIEEFNRDWLPHVVAAYGPIEIEEATATVDPAKES